MNIRRKYRVGFLVINTVVVSKYGDTREGKARTKQKKEKKETNKTHELENLELCKSIK